MGFFIHWASLVSFLYVSSLCQSQDSGGPFSQLFSWARKQIADLFTKQLVPLGPRAYVLD